MAISVVGTPQAGVKTDGTDVSLSPGACAVGDILVVWGGTFNRAGITPGPTGNLANFTVWSSVYRYTAGNPLFDVSWCRCTTATTPTVTCKGSGNSVDGVAYACYVLRGANRTFLSAVAGGATGFANAGPTGSTNPDAPSASCAGCGTGMSQWALDLALSTVSDNAVTVPSTPGTFVNKVTNNANASTNDYTVAGATYDMGTGTSIDPGAWTGWATGTWIAVTLVVSPALEATDPPAVRVGEVPVAVGTLVVAEVDPAGVQEGVVGPLPLAVAEVDPVGDGEALDNLIGRPWEREAIALFAEDQQLLVSVTAVD